MSSIRKVQAAFCMAMAAATVAGCSHAGQPQDKLSTTPLIIDDAMQQRDWDRSVAYYQNGTVKAWATRYPYVPSAHRPEWLGPVAEPVAFAAETLLLPVTLVTTPIGTPQTYAGVQYPPTYTAMPALPPSQAEQGGPPGSAYRGPAGTVAPGGEPTPGTPQAPAVGQ